EMQPFRTAFRSNHGKTGINEKQEAKEQSVVIAVGSVPSQKECKDQRQHDAAHRRHLEHRSVAAQGSSLNKREAEVTHDREEKKDSHRQWHPIRSHEFEHPPPLITSREHRARSGEMGPALPISN